MGGTGDRPKPPLDVTTGTLKLPAGISVVLSPTDFLARSF
jgi:hypothetical protein